MGRLEEADAYRCENRVSGEERPVYHVTPPVGWMNDPNGFSVYKGKIHLFYQYHPYSDKWGPMHWGHVVSTDFINWEEMPVALAPDTDYDFGGCFSGSAIETEEGHVLVYTGVKEFDREDGSRGMLQNQCIAIGDGEHYRKLSCNPVIPGQLLPDQFNREEFRDPKIWREDGVYYLVAGSKRGKNGQVVMFQSEDLQNWEYVSVLADNSGSLGGMWECPDFFNLAGEYILIVSPQEMAAQAYEFHNGNNAIYFVGEYDPKEHHFQYRQILSLDYGLDFYAPQTMEAPDGRRILIAWMQSWDADFKPEKQKWNGMMTIPRELKILDGILYQTPVRELESYRDNQVCYMAEKISGTCTLPGVKGRVIDLTLEMLEEDFHDFTVHFAHDDRFTTYFTYKRDTGVILFDRTYSGVNKDVVCTRTMKLRRAGDGLKLRMLLDRFSVELFINDGEQTFSAVFYTPLEADEIVFVCDGMATVNIRKADIILSADRQLQ